MALPDLAADLGATQTQLSYVVNAYPPERRTFAVSVWAGVSGAGAMLGVLLSGVMLEFFRWDSVQVAYGVAAAVVAVAALAVVPPSRNPALSLDAAGSVLALVGLVGLVLGIIEGPERGWSDPLTVGALVVGVVALAGFVRHEATTADPMLDVRLFRNPGLSAGSVLVFLQFFAAFGFFFLAPQFLQFVQGHDALGAALRLLPLALGIGPSATSAPGCWPASAAAGWARSGWVGWPPPSSCSRCSAMAPTGGSP